MATERTYDRYAKITRPLCNAMSTDGLSDLAADERLSERERGKVEAELERRVALAEA